MQQYQLGQGPYGSAYRGSISDLYEAEDLKPIEGAGRSFGLFLGHFDWQQSIRHTWQEPAKGLLAWLTGERIDREHVEVVQQVQDLRFTGDQHHLIVASSGAGKFRDVLSNMLLYDGSCETACLIIDPKGEIASLLGPIIDTPGDKNARTVILDPWDLTSTGRTESLTLLDGIRLNNPHCVKDARVLAEAIIIERGTEDGHWVATSRNFLAALLLYLGLDRRETEEERTLFRLRQIVTMPWSEMILLLGCMIDSSLFEGLLARAAQAMLNREEKERRSILSTLERDTAFVEDPSLWKAIKTSSLDINQLVMSNKRLHVIIPFDYTEQMSSWLRLTIAAFYNACLRNQLPRHLPRYLQFRHIIIDEFPSLGKLDFIMKGVAEARGAGMKFHLVVQNFGQLEMHYGKGWENLVSNSFVHAFGLNENLTADYLSKMTGQATVVIESKGFSESSTDGTSDTAGSSNSRGPNGKLTMGTSQSTTKSASTTKGTSVTFSSTGRAVLMPDEIRRISGQQQLLFLRQLPVFLTRRTAYYQNFQQFMPRHSLREVLAHPNLAGRGRSLVPFGNNLAARTPLSSVNAIMRSPAFTAPVIRPYTFLEALLQSPGVIAAAVGIVGFFLWFIPHEISSGIEERRVQAIAQENADRAAQRNAEAQRVAALEAAEQQKAAADLDSQAQAVDDRLRAPYAEIASSVATTLGRLGMCLSPGPISSALSCTSLASYSAGALAPLTLDSNARRQIFVSLSVSPENEKRGASFSGAQASMKIQSVFDRIDTNANEARFPAAYRQTMLSTMRAFKVSEQVIAACMAQGVSATSNGTSVSCRFAARPPTNGGLAQFTMVLARAL